MRKICSWCNKDMGLVGPDGSPDTEITHGMCEECAERLSFQMGAPLGEYLEDLEAPVVLLDNEARILAANGEAGKLVGRPTSEAAGELMGDVFECVNARSPDGCGHTVHCKACTIRLSVTATFETGEPVERALAYLKNGHEPGDRELRFEISTRKAGKLVILKIHDLQKG
jgi:hypothetical protein